MTRILITGVNGFVGPYLIAACQEHGWEVTGTEFKGDQKSQPIKDVQYNTLDVTNKEEVLSVVRKAKPDLVCHLAGFSSVRESWKRPALCRAINVEGTRNMLDALSKHAPKAKVLVISSSEIYGRNQTSPLTEKTLVAPENPYGESREEQEKVVGEYPNLHIIISRSFNHIGPAQPKGFVIPDFCAQVAAIEDGAPPEMKTGNLEVKRDFTDVRDVVKAYCTLLQQAKPHTIYNVCSGETHSLKELLDGILTLSIVQEINVTKNPDLIRPKETLKLRGSREKITRDTGWAPKIKLERTLKETLDYWRKKIAEEKRREAISSKKENI